MSPSPSSIDYKNIHPSDVNHNDAKQVKKFADANIDINEGMFGQVVFLGKLYQPIVHLPVLKKIFMFYSGPASKSPFKWFCEAVSSVSWFMVPLIWIPFLIAQVYLVEQWYPGALSTTFKVALFLFGMIVGWPTFEYVLHRFVFHYLTEHWLLNSGHFMIHGVHHLVPKDLERSIFPPVPALLFMVIPYHILSYLLSVAANHFFGVSMAAATQFRCVLFSGFLLGYVSYDCIHWYYHAATAEGWLYQAPLVGSYFSYLRQCHMQHHFVKGGENFNFGLTPVAKIVYDRVFGTSLDPNVTEQELQQILGKKTE